MPVNDTVIAKTNSANKANIRCTLFFAGKNYSVATDYGAASRSGTVLAAQHCSIPFLQISICILFIYLFYVFIQINKIYFNVFLLLPSASTLTRTIMFEGSWKNKLSTHSLASLQGLK